MATSAIDQARGRFSIYICDHSGLFELIDVLLQGYDAGIGVRPLRYVARNRGASRNMMRWTSGSSAISSRSINLPGPASVTARERGNFL